MAKNSNIEWTHHTFNPWRGCTKVSEGCKHCYAMTLSERYKGKHGVWGPKGTRIVASDSMWREPIKWNREAEQEGERKRVFCCSLADVFEDWQGPMSCGMKDFEGSHWEVTADNQSFFVRGFRNLPWHEGARLATMDDYRENLWRLIERTPMLDWLLLTKRPENIMRMVPKSWREGFPPNVWLGTSVEDQKTADERIPHLLKCPAAVRFLSCEPLLGPVDLSKHLWEPCANCEGVGVFGDEDPQNDEDCRDCEGSGLADYQLDALHWVICGGESGPGARPMHPDWARALRDQCVAAQVPFFFKQVGEWDCYEPSNPLWQSSYSRRAGYRSIEAHRRAQHRKLIDPHSWPSNIVDDPPGWLHDLHPECPEPRVFHRVGKHKAGRVLDGRTWDEFPEGECTK